MPIVLRVLGVHFGRKGDNVFLELWVTLLKQVEKIWIANVMVETIREDKEPIPRVKLGNSTLDLLGHSFCPVNHGIGLA